jgi:DNA-binding transcriptional LysR family regulator
VRLDLVVDERAAKLSEREAEIAVRFFKPTEGALLAKRVATLATAVLANRAYAASREARVEALDWTVLDLSPARTLDAELLARFPDVEPIMRTNMHLAQIEAVRGGLGVGLLPGALCQLLPDLVEIVIPRLTLPRVELWLVTPEALGKSARIRAVWDLLAESLLELESGRLLAS